MQTWFTYLMVRVTASSWKTRNGYEKLSLSGGVHITLVHW